MAFEQVYLRTSDGQQYGPVSFEELLQWHQLGRVPANGVLVDADTGDTRPVVDFPALAVLPPPMMGLSASAATTTAPTPGLPEPPLSMVNPAAKWATYLALLGLICLILPLPLPGPAAVILGIIGLRGARQTGAGRKEALLGLVLGSIITVENIILIAILIHWGAQAER